MPNRKLKYRKQQTLERIRVVRVREVTENVLWSFSLSQAEWIGLKSSPRSCFEPHICLCICFQLSGK